MTKAIKQKTIAVNTTNTNSSTENLKADKTCGKAEVKIQRKRYVTQTQTIAQTLNDAKHLYPTSKENIIEATKLPQKSPL